jgi:predicted DNA-binding antitoxin AbrB/MazE fold protein
LTKGRENTIEKSIREFYLEASKMVNTLKIEAVYSEGVFKPFGKISLPEGEKVEIEIKEMNRRKNISLRGLWKDARIKEEDIDEAKHIWGRGVKKQKKILESN